MVGLLPVPTFGSFFSALLFCWVIDFFSSLSYEEATFGVSDETFFDGRHFG
jgi:hypothetical protein